MASHHASVFPLLLDPSATSFELALFKRDVPTWVEHVEAVEIGLDISHAPSIVTEEVFHNTTVSQYETRPSGHLARHLYAVGRDIPAFQKKLLVLFGNDEKEVDRLDERLRREVKPARYPWRTATSRAFSFTYPANCQKVADALGHLLHGEAVTDYILVEPLAVAFSSAPFSPLTEWLRNFGKDGPARFNVRDRKKAGFDWPD